MINKAIINILFKYYNQHYLNVLCLGLLDSTDSDSDTFVGLVDENQPLNHPPLPLLSYDVFPLL